MRLLIPSQRRGIPLLMVLPSSLGACTLPIAMSVTPILTFKSIRTPRVLCINSINPDFRMLPLRTSYTHAGTAPSCLGWCHLVVVLELLQTHPGALGSPQFTYSLYILD